MRSVASALALVLTGCGAGQGRATLADPRIAYGSYDASGRASWYGEEVGTGSTASGARFDPAAITLAHRTLPLGSLVEVSAPRLGRSIVARVTDRGPQRADRLVDLSRGAAQALGLDRHPQATVRVRSVASGTGYAGVRGRTLLPTATVLPARGPYVVQVAAFSYRPRAEALARALGAEVLKDGSVHRVRLGPYRYAADAQRARDGVAARGYGDAVIRSFP